jgi:uncharacterized repeat protein (TIGR02543 family)
VDSRNYAYLKVQASFDDSAIDLTAEPWNATISYYWSAANLTGGNSPSVSERSGMRLKPLRSIGGIDYTCKVSVVTDATYTGANASYDVGDEKVYVHIQDPEVAISGSGSEVDPYLIENADQLAVIRKNVANGNNYQSKYIQMSDDIELPSGWTPIGENLSSANKFSGTFDGDGHTITYAYGSKALFGYTSGATIKNLSIYGQYIADNGLIAAGSSSGVTITNVTIKEHTTIRNSGLAGGESEQTTNITNCLIERNVKIGFDLEKNAIADDLPQYQSSFSSGPGVGGFASGVCGTITNCVNYGTVYGHSQVGGIVAFKAQAMRTFTVRNCIFAGTIIADGNIVGGIVGGGYNEVTAPNSPCGSIINCYSIGNITGNNKVGGIFGGENYVASAWANGPSKIQNNFFAGTVTATRADKNDPAHYNPGNVFRPGTASDPTYVGGIVGYMRSINYNNPIERNYYLEGCGATKGVGGADYVDTNWYQKQQGWAIPTYINGTRYFCSQSAYGVQDKDGVPDVLEHGLAGRLTRDDDPFGENADTLAKAVTAAQLKDNTVVQLLNEGPNSAHNWIQGTNYPEFSSEPITYMMELSGTYKTEYLIGEAFDTAGMVFTGTMTDGSVVSIDASEISFTGFNSSERGVRTIRASYSAASLEFEVAVLKPDTGGQLRVTFTLLGTYVHNSDTDGIKHTLRGGGLTVWIPKTTYEMNENALLLDVLEKALTENNMTWRNTHNGNYIAAITRNGIELAEFTNGVNSGWMYTLNGVHSGNGVAQQFLENGDDIVFHYTDDWKLEDSGFDDEHENNDGVNYTVSFNVDGGSEVEPITVSAGSVIPSEPATTRKGYDFLGWYDGNIKIEFPYTPNENLTLKAKWEISDDGGGSGDGDIEYTVSFNTDGGSLTKPLIVIAGGSIATAPLTARAGYTFLGWYDGNMKIIFPYTPTENLTLKAKWQSAPQTVKITINTGNGNKAITVTVGKNGLISKPANPKRAKYIFAGWYIGSRKVDFAKYKASGNVTLTAKWTKVSVAKVKNPKATKPTKNSVTLSWKKVSGASGYVIQYGADKKKLAKGKTVYVSAKSLKSVIKKLKKNKKYYFRVAAYKLDSTNAKVLGSYSAATYAKTKK